MDISKIVGSLALGVVIGLLSRFFFERFNKDEYTAKGLAAVIGCLLGGTAVGYLTTWLKDAIALGLYPVGLLIGLVSYRLIWRDSSVPPNTVLPTIQPVPTGPPSGPIQSPEPKPNEVPTFTLLEVTKTLRFEGKDGSRSHFQRMMKMRANARATDFWVCTVSADGTIENIRLDGSFGAKANLEPAAGQISIYAKFESTIEVGDLVELRVQYDLVNSFSKKTEYLGHEVQHQTEAVTLLVEFCEGRPCISAWCARKYAGDLSRVGLKIDRSESGLQLGTNITKMRIGEEYRLTWTW